MTNTTKCPIKYLPFLRSLRIVAQLSGWTSAHLHTEGSVAFLSLSRNVTATTRITITVYAVEDALYYDRYVHLSSGKFVKTSDFQPVRNEHQRRILVDAITGQGYEQISDADSIAAAHESFEICEAEAWFPSDMRSLSAEDLAEELRYF